MAIIHEAQLDPTKPALLEAWLDRQAWGGSGPVELVGGYRFDDPAGEVGVEGLVVRRGDRALHAALTYRAAPLEGADEHLVCTLEHSVLGTRWVYEASHDPVGLACFVRALRGEQQQASVEVWRDGAFVAHREPLVRVTREGQVPVDPGTLVLAGDLADEPEGAVRLVATWDCGSAVVATLAVLEPQTS
jgi:Maltokinase N-terminal cap domain